jgi:hypothetical protein
MMILLAECICYILYLPKRPAALTWRELVSDHQLPKEETMEEKDKPQKEETNTTEKGNALPCTHERIKQERIKGTPTGDHICLDCGKLS